MGNKNGTPVLSDDNVKHLGQTCGLTKKEVKIAFDEFIAEHPKGQISKKDYGLMMQNALPKKAAAKVEDHMFRVYDKDKNGTIDFVEFMVVYQIMSDGSAEEILRKIFNVFDVNRNGFINQKEMKRLVKDMMMLINEMDNPEQATSDMIANNAFKEMDKNQDGKISPEEFVAACMAPERFSEMLSLKIIEIFFMTMSKRIRNTWYERGNSYEEALEGEGHISVEE